MLQFIIGLVMGGIVGCGVCAICSIDATDNSKETPVNKETGDSNDSSK